MIEALNLKTSPHCWLPAKFVVTNTSHIPRINLNPKKIQQFWLPILRWTTEPNVPMKPPIREMHNLQQKKLPCLTKTIQFWKCFLKRTTPTPYILPELYPSTITHIKLKKFRKVQPTTYNGFPHPNTGLVHEPPLSSPYLASMTFLQREFLYIPYLHNHLPNKAKLNLLSRQIPKPPWLVTICLIFINLVWYVCWDLG